MSLWQRQLPTRLEPVGLSAHAPVGGAARACVYVHTYAYDRSCYRCRALALRVAAFPRVGRLAPARARPVAPAVNYV